MRLIISPRMVIAICQCGDRHAAASDSLRGCDSLLALIGWRRGWCPACAAKALGRAG